MDQRSQENFNRIIAIEAHALTNSDVAFLRARRDYLTEEQLAYYEDTFTRDTTPEVAVQPPILPVNLKNIASVVPSTIKDMTYNELLQLARTQGYKGGRLKRPELEALVH